MSDEHWTEGWSDAFCIVHKSYQTHPNHKHCMNRQAAGDMADLYGAEDCVWSAGRVAFDGETP